MVSEFCFDDRVECLKGVVGIWHRSVSEILIGEKYVQVCFKAIIRTSGSPVCKERLSIISDCLFFQKIFPAVVPALQHGTELFLVGGG